MSVPIVVAVTSAGGEGSPTLTLNVPSGTQVSDVMIAAVTWRRAYAGAPGEVTAPGGWTLLRDRRHTVDQLVHSKVWQRIATTSEPASYAWTWGADAKQAGGIITIRGADITAPINAAADNESVGAPGSVVVCPSITTTVDDCLLLAIAALEESGAGLFTWAAGTSRWEINSGSESDASGAASCLATRSLGAAGASGTTSSGDTENSGWVSHSLAVAPGVPGIWIDWDADGFDTDLTSTAKLVRLLPAAVPASDNITADVMAVSWSRGASSDHVSPAGPGNATIVVQNSDGKYNPDNSGSALYGKLVPGRPVWCGAIRTTGAISGSGTVRGFFAGRVTEIVPTPVPGGNPWAEILCEDPLGDYRRATASVTPSQTRSQGDFRGAILDAIGETSAHRSLETEGGMLPFSAADSRSALGLLEDLNRATASRHFIAPADSKESWYLYSTVNRLHKLTAAADEEINADDVTALSGYRVTNDTIVNEQRATVSPIDFSVLDQTVWTYGQTPLTVTSTRDVTIWAKFADYVFGAAVVASSSGGTLSTTLTNFGTTAKLVLHVTGAAVTIGALRITGTALLRGDDETVIGRDATSQDRYGVQAGTDISSDWIGQTGAAQGLVDYLTWKFRDPLKRPTITMAGKSGATFDTLLDRDLFDVITLTVDRLNVVSRRFEIIGLRGRLEPGLYWEVSYELQETPNQAALAYWVWDTSSWNGSDLWAPF